MRLFVVLLLVASAVTIKGDIILDGLDAIEGIFDTITSVLDYILGGEREIINTKPWFCHGRECPTFKVMGEMTEKIDGFEERCYTNTTWVTTETEVPRTEKETKLYEVYQKLYNYIHGENEKKMTIRMALPVLISTQLKEGTTETVVIRLHFFIPPTLETTIPKPIHADVKIIKYLPTCVYVHTFGGYVWSVGKTMLEKEKELETALTRAGKTVVNSRVLMAIYDPPTKMLPHHNEVWLMAPMKTSESLVTSGLEKGDERLTMWAE